MNNSTGRDSVVSGHDSVTLLDQEFPGHSHRAVHFNEVNESNILGHKFLLKAFAVAELTQLKKPTHDYRCKNTYSSFSFTLSHFWASSFTIFLDKGPVKSTNLVKASLMV